MDVLEIDAARLVHALPVLAAAVDSRGRFLAISGTYARLFGIDVATARGRRVSDVLAPAQFAVIEPFIARALAGEMFSVEAELPFDDIGVRRAQITYLPQHDAEGGVSGYLVIGLDIHEMAEARKAGDQRERELRLMLDDLPAMVASHDLSFDLLWVNESFREAFGLQADAPVVGRSLDELVGEAVAGAAQPFADRALAGETVVWEFDLKLGPDPRRLRVILAPSRDADGVVTSVLSLMIDVDEEHRAERALRDSEERYRSLVEHAAEAIMVFDADSGHLVDANPSAERLFETLAACSAAEWAAQEFGQPNWRQRGKSALSGRSQVFEWRLHNARTGLDSFIEVRMAHLPDRQRRLVRLLAVDVTFRRSAEEALRHSEQRWRTTFESLGEGVIATGPNHSVARMNSRAAELAGMAAQDTLGLHVDEVLRLFDADGRLIKLPLESLETDPLSEVKGSAVLHGPTGSRGVAYTAAGIWSDRRENLGVVVTLRDVTDQQRLQLQALHNEKMRALGQLAGGIAHDFNNVLAAVSGAAELVALRDGDHLSEQSLEHLRSIVRTATSAADLTGRLTVFARHGEAGVSAVDVRQLVHDLTGLIRRTTDRRIDLIVSDYAEEGFVRGEAAALQSAFLNIAVNACHAMEGAGGTLTIGLSNVELEAKAALSTAQPVHPGRYLEIRFVDTGVGISSEHVARIFEPFFTTRSEGRGSGLGLAAVYGIVLDHDGAIEVESEIGVGTTFRLLLPVAPQPMAELVAAVDGSKTPARPPGSLILVVEDEPQLLETVTAMLEELGFAVLQAADGRAALTQYQQRGREIDLVLIDLNMPIMDGAETIRRLRKINADCRIVITTGFSDPETMSALARTGANSVLRKPYSFADLRRLLSD